MEYPGQRAARARCILVRMNNPHDESSTTTTPRPAASIDWDALRRDLEWDAEAAERALLRRRAEQYAAPLVDPEAAGEQYHLLIFEAGGEIYGVDVRLVRAVRALGGQRITPVPATPPFYRGVVNLRGQIITVFDLRRFLDLPEVKGEEPRELVVARAGALELALLVHSVRGVMRVPVTAARAFEGLRYARGVTADRLVILDLARLFEDERLWVRAADE